MNTTVSRLTQSGAPMSLATPWVLTGKRSRRQFAQMLSWGAVGWFSAPAAGPEIGAEFQRAAVIGHTGQGDYGHGLEKVFQGLPGVEVVALADPQEAGRNRTARALGVRKTYADWREMLRLERPQWVVVAMRQADPHGEIVLACAEQGIHVFVEKPFVRSPKEADAILRSAERTGSKIAVAHTMRQMPVVEAFQQAVQGGLLGSLVEMRAFGKQDHRAGGEDLMVLGTHLFDLMRMFAGDPLWCSARVLVDGRDITVADRRRVADQVGWVAGNQVFATLAFPKGVNATFTSDARLREATGHWGIEFRGSKGVAKLNCDLSPSVFLRKATSWSPTGREESWEPWGKEWVDRAPEHTRAPVQDWLESVTENRPPKCSAADGAWAVEVVAAIYRSALTGRRMNFPLEQREHPLEG
ncbi:MAG: Gfo/Idh/MocA family oxidoreductase [Verrucomicrobia bacterium]|nr:Gfo/Idh/MocA family oxidoreductase [Verrucomicrobiota bacterium]